LPSDFSKVLSFNIGAENMDRKLWLLERKIKAVANFILTQPVYSAEAVEQARRRLGGFPVPVLLGILPLRSLRHAEFLHNEVPGITVTDEVRSKMRSAEKRAPKVGIELCRELLSDVSGAYFMPPFGRYGTVLEVLEGTELVQS
jgi:homocysteine S-methyltransferase